MQYNQQQAQALEMIGQFLQPDNLHKAFILKGSAGTGKTTSMNTPLCEVSGLRIDYVLPGLRPEKPVPVKNA